MEDSQHLSTAYEKENRGTAFLVIALFFTILAFIFVSLRIYTRIWITRAFGWDDGTIILSLVLAAVSTAFNVPEVIAGYGQHLSHLSDHQVIEVLKWNYLATPLLVFSLATSKISICLFLFRVLDQARVKFKRSFLYAIMLLLTLISVPSAGYALGQCQPVRKLWDPTTPGRCQDPRIFLNLGYANGAVNAFSDFALALFPVSFIKNLQIRYSSKAVLVVLMCCGVVCGALAITRTVLTGDLAVQSDITYDSIKSSQLAIVEENVSIIVACAPTMRSILKTLSQKLSPRKTIGAKFGGELVPQNPCKGGSSPSRLSIRSKDSALMPRRSDGLDQNAYGSRDDLVHLSCVVKE
ncbi:hypothetical protein MMC31_005359 [Peltigera leucophlebia]|nr:hypothetical protein [Peltigera leucophlebia]